MNREDFQILIVDDEPLFAEGIKQILGYDGYALTLADSAEMALDKAKWKCFDLIITDLMMPGMGGLELLKQVKSPAVAKDCQPEVILMTAYATIPSAVEAIREGASGYYVKGNDPAELLLEVEKVFASRQRIPGGARKGSQPSGKALDSLAEKSNALTNSVIPLMDSENEAFCRVVSMAKKAAASPVNILLLGESGVGKELFAQYIHELSPRCQAAFVAVNCQSLSDQVLESELFGHSKGAFTGAISDRMGRFESAAGGTLFLDEVADISLSTQVKLLRVIENKQIERLGSNDSLQVDFRLVTATNKAMAPLIEKGLFREDFYYRISTIVLEIPPLRERKEDLPKLVKYFVLNASQAMHKEIKSIEPEVWAYLQQYDYPGNVRELKNIVERLVVFSENGVITSQDLFGYSKIETSALKNSSDLGDTQTLRDFRAAVEKAYINSVLEKYNFNMTATAESLGITRRQLFNITKRLGLEKE